MKGKGCDLLVCLHYMYILLMSFSFGLQYLPMHCAKACSFFSGTDIHLVTFQLLSNVPNFVIFQPFVQTIQFILVSQIYTQYFSKSKFLAALLMY